MSGEAGSLSPICVFSCSRSVFWAGDCVIYESFLEGGVVGVFCESASKGFKKSSNPNVSKLKNPPFSKNHGKKQKKRAFLFALILPYLPLTAL